ncbi:MAG: FeoA family protein [Cyanobacteria bacterium P01_G01_bin.39]
MTHAIAPATHCLSKIKRFQSFVFISDSALRSEPKLDQQLHYNPDSQLLLSQAQVGCLVTICQINAPQDIVSQLNNLQFEHCEQIEVVSKTKKASVVVDLQGKLIGLGAEIAQQIVVSVVNQPKL